MPDLVTTGREAIQSHDWDAAREALSAADRDGGLSPDALIDLGDALWWGGHPDEAVATFERAYAAFVAEERVADAAATAALLAYLAMRRLKASVGTGWMARAEHLLEDQPESIAHAWLTLLHLAVALMMEGDFDKSIELADEAIEIALRQGSRGVQSMAMSFKGYALIEKGDWRDGMRMVDEAAVVAMSQEDLRATSDVYCNTIAACRNLADYRRAGEWTEEAERWMRSNSVGGYPGVCQVHRAELKRLRGAWPEAEQEARRACTELERFHLNDAIGFAHYEIGEVRRRMGDLDAAERAFMEAYERGYPPQPGYALLLKDRGDIEQATRAITGVLEGLGGSNPSAAALTRGRMLPARIEIAIAAGDLDAARAALEELEEVTARFEGASWRATALTCKGAVLLNEGQPGEAVVCLEEAWRLWQEVALPYESAQARTLLGRARLAAGDETGAMLEFRSARSSFEHLGAAADLRALDDLGATTGVESSEATRRRVTKTFLFTDIVTSTDLIGLIGDAAWEDLLKWHDRVLRDEIEGAGGQVVRHTGDGYFATFEEPRSAIESAVAIQRRLAQHRREHGFAPSVRVGMHVAEATRQGPDYAGQGVHAAARVGALAEREEILASAITVAAAGAIPYPVGVARTVELKGIAEPIAVQAIDWS
jgi:class 3 adenylate cyclase